MKRFDTLLTVHLKETVESIGDELKEVKEAQRQIKENQQTESELKSLNQHEQLIATNDLQSLTANNIQINGGCQADIARISQQIEELYIKYNLITTMIAKVEASIDDLEQYG